MAGFGIGFGYGFSGGRSVTYNADAQLFFTAAGITDSTEKGYISTWADATQTLRDDGDIVEVYLISTSSFASSLFQFIGLNQATYTVGNSPNWSATDGWFFNGVNQFLNSLINASTGLTNNNYGIGVFSLDDAANTSTAVGTTSGTNRLTIACENASNLTRWGAQDNATIMSGTAGDSAAYYHGYVLGANARKVYRNLVEIADDPTTAIAGTRPSANLYMGANNAAGTANSFDLRRIGMIVFTKGLDITKHTTLYNANLALMQSFGRI